MSTITLTDGRTVEAYVEPPEYIPKEIREKYGLGEFHDENRDKEAAFIEKVSSEVIPTISDEDQQYMIKHPDPSEYHFGLGMDIRNQYIYDQNLDFFYGMADALSRKIVIRIIEKFMNKRRSEYVEQISEQVISLLSSDDKLRLCNSQDPSKVQKNLHQLVREDYIGDQTFDFFYGMHGLERSLAEEIVETVIERIVGGEKNQ
ncbi:MAG: hypothetical protein IJ091_00700 [Oscillospiraceae bacterium]|nr:hypothetical protein [Oscillospiraceae bacterium]